MSSTQFESVTWTSRWVFFIAATAGAVGLGNIWNFPYIMAENGGLAFVALYIFCIVFMGVPMMLSEVAIGHVGRANPVSALSNTAVRSGASKRWSLIGYIGLLAGLFIFVMLTIVASWAFSYLIEMYQGHFIDIGRSKAVGSFAQIKADTDTLFFYQSAFIGCAIAILGFGVNKGLARGLLYLVPMSGIVLLFLLYHTASSTYFEQAVEFMLRFDASKLNAQSFILAFEHAFYTLSIGVGSLMVFGSYLPKRGGIGPIVFGVAAVDIAISGLVGLVVLPSLFLSQVELASGYDLLFVALPTAFGDMVDGQYLAVLFFLFVMLTALSSALVLLEPSVAWCSQRFKTGRWAAVVLVGFVAWLITLASFDHWQYIKELTGSDYKLFDVLNFMTAKVILPVAGLMVAIYAAWFLKPDLVRNEMVSTGIGWLYLWYFVMRFIVPTLFILVLVLNQLDIETITQYF
jgi:NSS family neurotransmitter:Na+ symporter